MPTLRHSDEALEILSRGLREGASEAEQRAARDIVTETLDNNRASIDAIQNQLDDIITSSSYSLLNLKKVASWDDIQVAKDFFSDGIINRSPRIIPGNPSNTTIQTFVRKELGDEIELQNFEEFMIAENWAQDIDGTLYPVELSALFDRDGNLAGTWIGYTNSDGYFANIDFISFSDDLSGATFTHLHPPGSNYYLSGNDIRIFTQQSLTAGLEEFRAISPDYTFAVRIDSNSYEAVTGLPLTDADVIAIANRAEAQVEDYFSSLNNNPTFLEGTYNPENPITIQIQPSLKSDGAIVAAQDSGVGFEDVLTGQLPSGEETILQSNTRVNMTLIIEVIPTGRN